MRRLAPVAMSIFVLAVLVPTGSALANPSPTGSPGQPGAFNGTTCQAILSFPGNAFNASGSVFNPNGTSGTVYAGNPETASLNNSNTPHAVSECDVTCFEMSRA